jgi:arsenical pump membrane protein
VLGYTFLLTVPADLPPAAGVAPRAGPRLSRLAGRSPVRLLLLVLVAGSLITTVLSLDTTAVLLTPVVLSLAARLDLPALPFAMATVWAANTGSLLQPVSNLTNLLASGQLGLPVGGFAARKWLPACAALAASALALWLTYRRPLAAARIPSPLPPVRPRGDRALFWVAAAGCAALGPLLGTGWPPWALAAIVLAPVVAVVLVRRPALLRPSLVPWRLVLLVEGLFLAVTALVRQPAAADWLRHLLGSGHGVLGVWRTAGVAAAGSNLVDNLPTYLGLDGVLPHHAHQQLLAVLLGTNAGSLLTLWGSLATLLWRERCRSRGLEVRARDLLRVGALGVPLALALTGVALAWSAR